MKNKITNINKEEARLLTVYDKNTKQNMSLMTITTKENGKHVTRKMSAAIHNSKIDLDYELKRAEKSGDENLAYVLLYAKKIMSVLHDGLTSEDSPEGYAVIDANGEIKLKNK